MGWGWETQGQPLRLAVWGRKRSTARVTSVPVSRVGRGTDPARLLTLCCGPQSHPGAPLAWGPTRARLHALSKPPPVPWLQGEGRLTTHMPHFLYFCLKQPGASVPQIPPDEPADPAHQPTDILDAASPPRPPGAKGLGQISLRSELKSTTGPPSAQRPIPRGSPASPQPSQTAPRSAARAARRSIACREVSARRRFAGPGSWPRFKPHLFLKSVSGLYFQSMRVQRHVQSSTGSRCSRRRGRLCQHGAKSGAWVHPSTDCSPH